MFGCVHACVIVCWCLWVSVHKFKLIKLDKGSGSELQRVQGMHCQVPVNCAFITANSSNLHLEMGIQKQIH